jgi:hypothetical protein
MAKFKVPQEMKSFWGEFWCGPEEIPEKSRPVLIARYMRHGEDKIAAQVAVLVTDGKITYTVCSAGSHCVTTPSNVHAADLCRWLRFGEIEFVA